MSERLTPKTLAAYRSSATTCELCGGAFTEKNPRVVDHCHATGKVRGVLHRGCNAMLGVIENGRARYQLLDVVRLARMLGAIPSYLMKRRDDAPLYPSHRDAEQKRELKNKRARAARAIRKNQ